MTPTERARKFLRQCAPHMRGREWYLIIDELVKQIEATPERAAQRLLEGYKAGLEGKALIAYAKETPAVESVEGS